MPRPYVTLPSTARMNIGRENPSTEQRMSCKEDGREGGGREGQMEGEEKGLMEGGRDEGRDRWREEGGKVA